MFSFFTALLLVLVTRLRLELFFEWPNPFSDGMRKSLQQYYDNKTMLWQGPKSRVWLGSIFETRQAEKPGKKKDTGNCKALYVSSKSKNNKRTTFEKKRKYTATTIPLSLKYNKILPKTEKIVMNHSYLLHTNSNLAAIFQISAILAFRQNKNLRDIIGTKLIEKGKIKRKSTATYKLCHT